MIYRSHLIEIWVNGKKLELESQKSLNLRFQNVLFNPEKITSTQAEYSFEFEIPSTPNNDKIFDYANNLSKLNKFHARWNSEVYADGNKIFEGSMTLNGYKNKMYKVNLVSVKVYSLEDIFGDSMMNEFDWFIPFSGASSIDYYNSQLSPEVTFPLVSYGVFQKSPYNSDSVAKDFTSKFDLDEYNRWYVESFYPSPNMLEALKNVFKYKNYTVGGDAFEDTYLKDVYMSVNLADGQSPEYNLGYPTMGKLDLSINWTNPMDVPPSGLFDTGTTYGTVQDLKFPYFKSGNDYWDCKSGGCIEVSPDYNLSKIRLYDMLSSDDGGSVTVNDSTYLYQPNEHVIVIPADGFYKIELSASTQLLTTSQITASQWVHSWDDNVTAMTNSVEEKDISFNPNLIITAPLEIQLVRNYEEDLELIKGKYNIQIHDGYPDNTTEMNHGRYQNYTEYMTCFPHEKLGTGWFPIPTKLNDLSNYYTLDASVGYVNADRQLMAYDPVVSEKFICGFTTMGNHNGGGCGAVIKNGYSWSKSVADRFDGFYTQQGYHKVDVDYTNTTASSISYIAVRTDYNENTYADSPEQTFNQNGNNMSGRLCCMVYLKKNDVLQLYGVHRDYNTTSGTSVSYQTSANVHLTIEAASPNDYYNLKNRSVPFGYNSPSEFDYDLRVSNFFNKEKKMSEWVQNVADAFNLEIIQEGNSVFINTKKKFNRNIPVAVDIDDRVNSDEAESSMINYPRSMAVKYKIDTDEWGAERSAVEANGGDETILNQKDWKDYIDSGFTTIQLNDDLFATSTSDKSLQFSYTWYDNFNWYAVNSGGTKTSDNAVRLRIPVISKYSYMIDGYDYEESMKHDGYGLSQRFWFKPNNSGCYVWTKTYPAEMIMLYEPTNLWTNYQDNYFNLSYKNTESSILTKYFNISSYLASNYVEVGVYLSPDEYNRIKNGSMVHFDSDLYYPVEINGYDPSGYNPTTLKLMKKVV